MQSINNRNYKNLSSGSLKISISQWSPDIDKCGDRSSKNQRNNVTSSAKYFTQWNNMFRCNHLRAIGCNSQLGTEITDINLSKVTDKFECSQYCLDSIDKNIWGMKDNYELNYDNKTNNIKKRLNEDNYTWTNSRTFQ